MSRLGVIAIVAALAMTACSAGDTSDSTVADPPPIEVTSTAPKADTMPPDTSAPTTLAPDTTAQTTTTTPLPRPLGEWVRLPVDSAEFGEVTVTDGAISGTRLVLAGCTGFDGRATEFPIWWGERKEPSVWQRSTGPAGVSCLGQVESTPFGFFAAGTEGLLRSADGVVWESVDVSGDVPFGWVTAILPAPAPAGDRLTVLLSSAAEGESTLATLVTTTDGETWEAGPADSAAIFDNSTISSVMLEEDGLLIAGASPGGEFVPTAAVFASPDGQTWQRVTPTTGDFHDKVITAMQPFDDRVVAVGGDFFVTGLMTAWTSPNGTTWTRSPHPDEETDPSVAFMTAEALTRADGALWAAGTDSDARRPDDGAFPAMWTSRDGVEWERVDFDSVAGRVPFVVIETDELTLGVWPPPFSTAPDPVQVFVEARL